MDKIIIGVIEDKTIKEGVKSDGTEWMKFSFKIKTDEGKNMTLTTFDKKHAEFKKGMRAKFIYKDKIDGEYTYHNITEMEQMLPNSAPIGQNKITSFSQPGAQKAPAGFNPEIKIKCLECAIEFYKVVGSLSMDKVLKLAEAFESWVYTAKETKGDQKSPDYDNDYEIPEL